ncbi:MAG: hypothetical protein IKQ17_00515 [Kiritimatiellae bacterium]|nr:hypothetical protein [Kiritimatiellia bacterium]
MPLSIQAYRDIANSGVSQLALLSEGRRHAVIGKASDAHVGFLQRLFNTEASKKVNIAITSDFKASLAREYGSRVADEAFDAVIGKAGLTGAKLSATLVSKTLSMADKILAARLEPPPITETMLTMRLEGVDATFNTRFMLSSEKKMLNDAKATLTKLHDLLADMPTDKLALDNFKEKIGEAKATAQELITDLGAKRGTINGIENVIAALQKAVSMVDGKIEEAAEVCNSNPITYKSLTDFAGKFIEAAKRAMANLAGKDGNGTEYGLNAHTRGQLIQTFQKEQIIADLGKAIPQIPEGATENDMCLDPKAFVGKDFAQKVAKHCADLVMKDLKANVVDGKVAFEAGSFTKDFAKAIQTEMGKILNEGNWDPIEKNVTFSLEGVSLKGKSVITPAAHMNGEMSKLYNDGGPKGYNCQSFGEAKHAVNLAHSEFKVEINGRQQTIFSGIRHGVHAAVDIASKRDFKAANESRARETLIAAFTSNPSLVKKALGKPDETCKFVFNSVSLLTPDFARNIFGGKHEDEKTMLKAQTEAYQSLNGKPIELEVKDENGKMVKVKIQPVITTFNYGVNWGGVGGLSALFGGWGATKDMNAKGLVELNRFANTTLAEINSQIESSADPAERQSLTKKAVTIRTLLRQINSIDQQKTYSSDGHEAYKMASRIAVLTNLLGGVPAWNCKSGKDRTGMMDVECKFLATLAALGKDIPEPGAQLNSEQKMLYRNLLLQSGNHEMQKYNTGIAGYKLEGVGSITERIGDIAAQRMFLGASKIVNS